jgi:hypothetical protein
MSLSLEENKSIWIFLSLCVATSAVAGSTSGAAVPAPSDVPLAGRGVGGGAPRWQPAPQRPR